MPVASPIFQLCDEYVVRSARLDPIAATMRGISGVGELPPGTDYGPDGLSARADLVRDVLHRVAQLEPTDRDDRFAAAHLRERLGAELAWYDSGEQFRQLRTPFGLVMSIRNSVDLMPRANDADWAAIAARLRAVPAMLGSWRSGLTVGVERRLVAARRQALEGATQAARYAGLDGAEPTFDGLLASYGDGPLRSELTTAAQAAHAAFAETASYLRDVYAPVATETDGVGAERYALASRLTLGADIDPVEAYEWGWAELRRIETELAAEAERVRSGATVDEAVAVLEQTEFVEGQDAYRAWLQERHHEAIEQLHGTHFDIAEPLRTVDVTLALGSTAGAPYYTPPSEDLTRPGRTWWPLAGRQRFGIWRMLTTVFHEGVPGHHLQLGAARVAGNRLSRFAKVSSLSGHGEGWALYSERLADELGWFSPPGTRLGMLEGSAARAARVVIDIGLHLDLPLPAEESTRHGRRWSFEVGADVLRTRGRMAEHNVHPEMVRYAGWPGQAPSYKLGERAWVAARDEAERRAGPAFDLKKWHTDALSLGPIGLEGLADALRSM